MNTVNLASTEIEQERERQAAELSADGDTNWVEQNRPGTFGCHELLDRSLMLATMVETEVQNHPACVANAEWFMLAERAVSALNDLYQRVGAEHLSAD
jgi:hypothetical protein